MCQAGCHCINYTASALCIDIITLGNSRYCPHDSSARPPPRCPDLLQAATCPVASLQRMSASCAPPPMGEEPFAAKTRSVGRLHHGNCTSRPTRQVPAKSRAQTWNFVPSVDHLDGQECHHKRIGHLLHVAGHALRAGTVSKLGVVFVNRHQRPLPNPPRIQST